MHSALAKQEPHTAADRGHRRACEGASYAGRIAEAPRGDRDFGYDPIFHPPLEENFRRDVARRKEPGQPPWGGAGGTRGPNEPDQTGLKQQAPSDRGARPLPRGNSQAVSSVLPQTRKVSGASRSVKQEGSMSVNKWIVGSIGVVGLCAGLFSAPLSPSSGGGSLNQVFTPPFFTVCGKTYRADYLGIELDIVGDVNGDGRDDVLIGSLVNLCVLISGRDGTTLRVIEDPRVLKTQYFGAHVAATGDVNGDGVPDMSVASESSVYGDPVIYVLDGATGNPIWAKREHGGAVHGAGDLNGDGRSDVIRLQWTANTVTAYQGDTGAVLWTRSGEDHLGLSMAVMGDVSGDGVPDIAFGESDQVVVKSGVDGATLYSIAESYGVGFGSAIAAPGDLNRDGLPDLLIGSDLFDGRAGRDSGRIDHYSGTFLVRSWEGSRSKNRLGGHLKAAGDVDCDGMGDFLATELEYGNNEPHKVLLISGRTGKVIRSILEEADGDDFGTTLAGGARFNGDRCSDFVIGAYRGSSEGAYADGKVYFYLGGQ